MTVNEGLAINLMALAVALLAETTTLSEQRKYLRIDTGDGCQGSARVLRVIDWRFSLVPQLKRLKDRNAQHVAITSSRLDFAQAAARAAMFFSMLHEMSHIVLGHVRWLYREYGLASLSETEKPGPLDAATFQALEIHADMMAASRFLSGDWDATNTHANGFGVGLLLHAIASVPQRIENYNDKKHPHPLIRFMSLYGMEVAPAEEGQAVPPHTAWRDGLVDSSRALFDIKAEYMTSGPLQDLLTSIEPGGGTTESAVTEAMMATYSDVHRILDRKVVALKEYG
ncbi:MAG: hypothetical protein V3T84_12615 [Phycisphaerales bacterium]